MKNIQIDILNKRNQLRKRRNVIRRIFLVLFISISVLFFRVLFAYPYNKLLEINVINNKYVNDKWLKEIVLKNANNKNIFIVSPRYISKVIVSELSLFKAIFIRRYFFPKPKIFIVLNEKNIYSKVYFKNDLFYMTDEGELINPKYLNLTKLPSDLISVYIDERPNVFSKNIFSTISRLSRSLEKLNIKVLKFLLDKKTNLFVYSTEEQIICLGMVNNGEVLQNLMLLQPTLELIQKNSVMMKTIDLRENSYAILRKESDNSSKNKKSLLDRFKPFKTN